MKKLRLFLMTMLLSAVSMNMFAYVKGDVVVHNGIKYEVRDGTANPIPVMLTNAKGATETDVVVPGTFTDGGDATFIVTHISEGSNVNWPSTVTSITLPETVTNLAATAFMGSSIKTIHFPKNVSAISDIAFWSEELLETITVDDDNPKFQSINGVLYSKDGKTLVHMPRCYNFGESGEYSVPEGTEVLRISSFYYTQGLKKLVLPKTLKEVQKFRIIGNGSYYYSINGCSNLAAIDVTEDNPYLTSQDGVVYNDDMTTLILYPQGKTDVSFTVPETVTKLGACSCMNAQFETLDLKNVEEIGDRALFNANKLTSFNVPAGLTTIPEGAVSGNKIKNIFVAEGNLNYKDIDGVLFTKDGKTLLQFPRGRGYASDTRYEYVVPEGTEIIGSASFAYCHQKKVTIAMSVTKINDHAFYDCSNLGEVVMPEGALTEIGASAFQRCDKLTTINIPSTVKKLPDHCFWGCTSLANISIAEGLEELSESMVFYNCAFTSFTLPKSVKTVGKESFRYCKKMTEFIVPDNSALTSFGKNVFMDTPVENITFGANSKLKTIGASVFADMETLKYIKIPASVTKIESSAFARTPNLATIEFEVGSQLTTIGAGAFADCGVTEFNIPEGVRTIEREAFRNCNVLEEVNLSLNVQTVSPEAFKYCTKLTAINVPAENTKYSSVDGMLLTKDKETLVLFPAGKANSDFTLLAPSITTIGDYAFYYCENLENVTIPNKVTSIGKRAFGFCTALNTVTFLCDNMISPDNVAQILGEASFDDGNTNADGTNRMKDITIYVRQGELATYEAESYYNENFKDIKPSFVDEVNGGEYIAVSEGAVDLLSLPNVEEGTYTYIMPREVKHDGKTYKVALIGDYLFQDVTQDIEEVVVFDNVQYIGAKAFVSNADGANGPKVKNLFFIESEPTNQMLSTTRFKLNETGTDYSEIPVGTNIFVKKSAIEKYEQEWPTYADKIEYKIPLPAINTKFGTFAREFDTDFSEINGVSADNPVTDTPKLIAFTANGKYTDRGNDYKYVQMESINCGATDGTDGTYVPAGTGVLLKAYDGSISDAYYQIGENDVNKADENSMMKGTTIMSTTTVAASDNTTLRYLVSGGMLHKMTAAVDFAPHKAYFEIPASDVPAGAKLGLIFTEDDGTTTAIDAIEALGGNDSANDIYYNLNGQRVNNPTKGVYIVNGKKVIVK